MELGGNPSLFESVPINAASIADKVKPAPDLIPVAFGVSYPTNHLYSLGVLSVGRVSAKLDAFRAVIVDAGENEGHLLCRVVEALASDALTVAYGVRYRRGQGGQFTDCRNCWQA